MPNIKEKTHTDWIKTGLRIQEEIDCAKMTYVSIAECLTSIYYVTTSRQYISDICKGKAFPPLYTLKALTQIFDCDTAYLLCEQDCRKREVTDIHAYTGLSENAIETLHAIHYNKVIVWITRSWGFVNTNFSSIGSELCAFSESNTSVLPSSDNLAMPTVS